MKRFLMTSGVAAVLAVGLGGSAWAVDTTGEIDITGSVGAKCTVITGGPGPNGANFGATVPLGELADANGHLRSDIQASSAIGVLTLPFTLSCSGANAAVTVQADPLANAAAAPTGYANRIDYTANAHFLLIAPPSSTSTLNVTDASLVAGATSGAFFSGCASAFCPPTWGLREHAPSATRPRQGSTRARIREWHILAPCRLLRFRGLAARDDRCEELRLAHDLLLDERPPLHLPHRPTLAQRRHLQP